MTARTDTSSLFARIFCISFCTLFSIIGAYAAEDSLSNIPVEGLDQLKLTLESRLQEVSGHPVLCKDEVKQCIDGYDKLIGFDWSKSTLEKGKKLIVSSHLPSGIKPGYDIINPREPADALKHFLGNELFSTSQLASTSSPSCPNDETPSVAILSDGVLHASADPLQRILGDDPSVTKPAPLACPNQENYYDDLFKNGSFDTTIVWGYFDEHDETFKGYLTEQLFKTRKIGIFLEENKKELNQMLTLLRTKGFQIDSQSETEWHLSRPFQYKGEKKTARVHLYSSTVKCAGEVEKDGMLERYDNNHCAEQVAATQRSLKAFSGAFGKSQLIVYNGHSRLGRGPDFGPLGTATGKFPIAQWALDDVNLNHGKTTLFLGSCNSMDYFKRAVDKKKRALSDPEGLKLLGIAGDGSWSNSAIETSRLIQMMIEARCPQDITDAMNLPRPDDWNYKIDFVEASNWLHSRQPAEAPKSGKNQNSSAPVFQLRESKDGDQNCVMIGSQQGKTTETQVDIQFCASNYKLAKAKNGKSYCYLEDAQGYAIGDPLDDELCKDNEEDASN